MDKIKVIAATPAWGDGKNDDNSELAVFFFITTKDGKKHEGSSAWIKDKSSVEPNTIREWYVYIDGQERIEKEDIVDINLRVRYRLGDNSSIFNNDKWNVRMQVVMYWPDGTYLSPGYNEPAAELHFENGWKDWYPFPNAQPIVRANLSSTVPILSPPIG